MDTGSHRSGTTLPVSPREGLALAVFLVFLGLVLWSVLGMDRGVLLSTGVRSRVWPWAPLMTDRKPEAQVLTDPVWQFVPWIHFVRRELASGRIPLWNPHQNGGQPLVGNPQAGLGSPLLWPAFVLGVARGWNLSLLLRMLTAVAGAYLWLRGAGRSPPAAVLGCLVFGLSGPFVAWLEHPHTLVAAWVPWLLLAVDQLLDGTARGRIAGGAFATALVVAGGHPETALMAAVLTGAMVLVRGRDRASRLRPVGAAAIGVGLAMPLLLPFAEYLRLSAAWQGSGREPFLLPWSALLRFVEPHAPVGHPIEAAATVSLTALLLAVVGLAAGRREQAVRFWGAAALGMILVAYDSPLGRLVAFRTPIFGTRVLLLLPLAGAFLASRGIDRVLRALSGKRARPAVAAALPLLAGIELLLAARGVHAVSPPREVTMTTPLIRFLQSREGPFRILPLHTFLPPESATLYGLDDVRGYDALAVAGWLSRRDAMGRFGSLPMVTDVLEPWNVRPGGEALDFWNVEYLLVHPQFDLTPRYWGAPLGLDLELVYDGPDGRVLRNRRVLPRVRLEGSGTVRILERTPVRWLVETDSHTAGRLVVADPWFPGWCVTVDDLPVSRDPAPGDPVTVDLPAGRHRVELSYRPVSFRLGLWAAAVSLLVLFVRVWGGWSGRFFGAGHEGPAPRRRPG